MWWRVLSSCCIQSQKGENKCLHECGLIFLTKVTVMDPPTTGKTKTGWSWDLSSLPPCADLVKNISTKKLLYFVQHKMPVPPKQIWFYLSWLFICITVVTSESQLDTKPHVFPISECLQIKGLLLVNYVRDEKIFVQRSGELLSLTYSPLIFGIMWTKCCVLLPCQVHSGSFEGK